MLTKKFDIGRQWDITIFLLDKDFYNKLTINGTMKSKETKNKIFDYIVIPAENDIEFLEELFV